MEWYTSLLKHASKETCFAIEDIAPAKQQRTLDDDIVFGTETPKK